MYSHLKSLALLNLQFKKKKSELRCREYSHTPSVKAGHKHHLCPCSVIIDLLFKLNFCSCYIYLLRKARCFSPLRFSGLLLLASVNPTPVSVPSLADAESDLAVPIKVIYAYAMQLPRPLADWPQYSTPSQAPLMELVRSRGRKGAPRSPGTFHGETQVRVLGS